jgi:hypothetical protein
MFDNHPYVDTAFVLKMTNVMTSWSLHTQFRIKKVFLCVFNFVWMWIVKEMILGLKLGPTWDKVQWDRLPWYLGCHVWVAFFIHFPVTSSLCGPNIYIYMYVCVCVCVCVCGPGSIVGIATDYGLDGPGIEFRWGRDFPHLSRPGLRPTQRPVRWIPGLSRGYGAAGAWRCPSPPSSAEVKNRVELYVYSP